ncbi:MAG: DUF1648 domain-containing protein [Bacteroidota bacterium]
MGKRLQRPVVKLPFTAFDSILEIFAFVLLVFSWGYIFYKLPDLPAQIPVHFDLTGKVDRIGSKTDLYWIPVIASVLYIGLSVLNLFPHKFNYLVTITENNALKQYRLATRLIRTLKVLVNMVFGWVITIVIRSANGTLVYPYEGILVILLLFIPVIVYLIAASSVESMRIQKDR